jgi:hypothetical protein
VLLHFEASQPNDKRGVGVNFVMLTDGISHAPDGLEGVSVCCLKSEALTNPLAFMAAARPKKSSEGAQIMGDGTTAYQGILQSSVYIVQRVYKVTLPQEFTVAVEAHKQRKVKRSWLESPVHLHDQTLPLQHELY